MSKTEPQVPDLRAILREASRPSATVTVPLKQGLAERIRQAEAELQAMGTDFTKGRRMATGSPARAKAKEIEELRAEMAASALTFHFEAPTKAVIDKVREDMGGRDDDEELDYRYTAATCVKVTGQDGVEYPDRLSWEDFKALRESLGEPVYLATIKEASDRVFQRQWSVPFSSVASLILETGK